MEHLIGFKNLTYFEELSIYNKEIIEKEEELLKLKNKHHEIALKIKTLSLEEIVKELSSFVDCSLYNEYCILIKNYEKVDLTKIEKMYPYLSLSKEDNKVYLIKSGTDNYDFYNPEGGTY